MHWNIGDRMARTSTTSSDAIISALAGIHPESNMLILDSWIDSVRHNTWQLSVIANLQVEEKHNGLLSVVQRCNLFTSADVGVKFLLMVSYMELAVRCQRYVIKSPVTSTVNNRSQHHTEPFRCF
jgi:hypothetical protein